jgi:hypothetical protein
MTFNPYGSQQSGNPRDGITQALMQQAWPPPGLAPNNLSVDVPGLSPQQAAPLAGAGQSPAPAPAPAGQPAMAAAPPMQPAMGLPGIMQPGQLPMGMNPQSAAGGSPPQPIPPRAY